MARYSLLNAYERARIVEIQDQLIELYVDRRHALAARMPARARNVERQIDDLLEEKADLERSTAPR